MNDCLAPNGRCDDPEPFDCAGVYVQLGEGCVILFAPNDVLGLTRLSFEDAAALGEYLFNVADWQLIRQDQDA